MSKKDIEFTETGDLLIGSVMGADGNILRDFSVVTDQYAVKQSIEVRLKTQLKEFFLHQDIGSELINIIGERNTRENAIRGKNYIISAIVKKNYLTSEQINIETIPVSTDRIAYVINVTYQKYPTIKLVLEVDLQDGIRRIL